MTLDHIADDHKVLTSSSYIESLSQLNTLIAVIEYISQEMPRSDIPLTSMEISQLYHKLKSTCHRMPEVAFLLPQQYLGTSEIDILHSDAYMRPLRQSPLLKNLEFKDRDDSTLEYRYARRLSENSLIKFESACDIIPPHVSFTKFRNLYGVRNEQRMHAHYLLCHLYATICYQLQIYAYRYAHYIRQTLSNLITAKRK